MNTVQQGHYPSRNVRGAVRHARRVGQRVPLWMMCSHTLDMLMWAKWHRLKSIGKVSEQWCELADDGRILNKQDCVIEPA